MKVLVDTQTDEIRGRYEEPLDFSISGRYVIDIPEGFGINPQTNSVTDLITEKVNTFIRLHPTLPNSIYDELLAIPNVDPSSPISSRFLTGPFKRTAILPGGHITTNVIATIAGFSSTFFHFHAYLLHSEPGDPSALHPSPSRLLYGHDGTGFVEPAPGDFTIDYMDITGTGAPLYTPTPGVEDTTFSSGGVLSFRIRITNNHASRVYNVSDWIFLYSNP